MPATLVQIVDLIFRFVEDIAVVSYHCLHHSLVRMKVDFFVVYLLVIILLLVLLFESGVVDELHSIELVFVFL